MAETRRCVGSARFGIDAHEAPIGNFSAQPSQRDGLSRMCSTHWKQYVAGLAREAKERVAPTVTSRDHPAPVDPAEPPRKAKRSRPKVDANAQLAQESPAE